MTEVSKRRAYALLKLCLLAALLAGAYLAFDWGLLMEDANELSARPEAKWIFLCVLGLGTVAGFPVSVCYFGAGALFGLWTGLALCLCGIFISSSLSYIAGRAFLGGALLERWLERFRLVRFLEGHRMNVNFFVRAVPGVPYWLQGLILAAIKTPYALYIWMAVVVQGIISFAMCFLGAGLAQSAWLKVCGALALVGVLAFVHWALLKFCGAEDAQGGAHKRAWKIFRFFWALVSYILFNFVFFAATLPVALIFFWDSGRRRRAISKILTPSLRWYCARALPWLGVYEFLRVRGLGNVSGGGRIYVANHRSFIDSVLLLAFVPNCGILLRREYSKWLIVWWLIRVFDFISIDQRSPESTTLAKAACANLLKSGKNLIIFPEGTRSPSRRVLEFKSFAFKLSKECGAPVVPCAVFSKEFFLAKTKNSLIPRAENAFYLEFFGELKPEDFRDSRGILAAAERKIASSLAKLEKDPDTFLK